MLIIASNEDENNMLKQAAMSLENIGLTAEIKHFSDARIISTWGDGDIPKGDDENEDNILDDAQKVSFWAYSASSLDAGLCSDGNERLSDLYDDWRRANGLSAPMDTVEAVPESIA